MFCPNCQREYKSYETVCPSCEVTLVAQRPDGAPDPDATLVSVFSTLDPALLPLATMTLDEGGIEYVVRGAGSLDALRYSPGIPDPARSDATHEILVRTNDAARARDLTADLAGPSAVAVSSEAPPPPADNGVAVVDLHTGQAIGPLTQAQAQFLVDQLEEASPDEARYYIDAPTIDMLEGAGADTGLIDLLRRALGSREGMEIRF